MKASHYLADYVDNLDKEINRLTTSVSYLEETVLAHRETADQYRKKLDDLHGEIASLKAENKKLDELLAGALL